MLKIISSRMATIEERRARRHNRQRLNAMAETFGDEDTLFGPTARFQEAANEAIRRDTIRLTDMTEDQLDVALFTQSAGTLPRDYQPVWYPTKDMLDFFKSMATSADEDEDDTPDDGA